MRWKLLDAVPQDHALALLALARRRRFRKGEPVFHEGDPGDSLHLIDKGFAAVRVATPLGEVATLRILAAGDYFGDLALVSHGARSATVAALGPLETLELSRADMDAFRRDHHSIDDVLLEAMIENVRRLSTALLEAMYLPVPKRISRRLLALCDTFGGKVIPLTQEDLAGLCGTTRQTVNHVLIELQTMDAISLGRGCVTVIDGERLARHGR